MEERLHIDQVLDFCDLPQVMTARDNYDTLYLCLLYDDEEEPKYTAVRISAEMLSNLKEGKYDLRQVFSSPEIKGEYYDAVVKSEEFSMSRSSFVEIPETRLPLPGYFLTGCQNEKITVSVPRSDRGLFESIARRFGWIAM